MLWTHTFFCVFVEDNIEQVVLPINFKGHIGVRSVFYQYYSFTNEVQV